MSRLSKSVVRFAYCSVVFVLAAYVGVVAQPTTASRISRAGPQPPAGNYRILHEFQYQGQPDGDLPSSALIAVNGSLYGTTMMGGRFASGIGPFGAGTIFKISTSGSESVLYSFGSGHDGALPSALINVNGVLYGTTRYGGSHQICVPSQDFGNICNGGGVVYAFDPTGGERVIYNFASRPEDGAVPSSQLVYANGMLYGTTQGDTAPFSETLFGVSLRGAERVLYSFGNSSNDARTPNSDLLATDGAGYGTTHDGGSYGAGTIYKFSSAGLQVLYNFKGGQDGAGPGNLLFVDGTFYGTTDSGGVHGTGTLFALNRATNRVLYSFKNDGSDGAIPVGLTLANGAFYVVNKIRGAYGYGVIFKVTMSGSETVLHSFGNLTDGENPAGGLVYVDGALYGTTAYGGAYGGGTVFKLAV